MPMLSRDQIEFFNDNGYVMVEDAVTPDQLATLRKITHDLIEQSRALTVSDDRFDLDDGHTADNPRLTRIKLPHKQDPYYWEVLTNSRITAVLNDLLGPDVLLQTAKLNTKQIEGLPQPTLFIHIEAHKLRGSIQFIIIILPRSPTLPESFFLFC